MHRHLIARLLGALSILLPTLAHAASIEVIDDQLITSGVHRELEFKRGELQLEAKGEAIALAGKRSVQRMTQTYRGVPIYGHSVAFERDAQGLVIHARGRYLARIEQDLPNVKPTLNPDQAVQALQEQWRIKKGVTSQAPSNTKTKLFVYQPPHENRARLIYKVSFVIDNDRVRPSYPTGLIDARSGEVLKWWEGVASRQPINTHGPGGNVLIGKYHYGKERGPLFAMQRGRSCSFSQDGIEVFLGSSVDNETPYVFPCPHSVPPPINGGYGSVNDLFYHAVLVRDLYLDVLGIPPIKGGFKVRSSSIRADLAIWIPWRDEGSFFSGASWFHPMVSADIVAHEISHGFTEHSSGMTDPDTQEGAINESFSDMAGEATKFRRDGKSDFIVLSELTKPDGDYGTLGGLRRMCEQSTDGKSIEHASQFDMNGMDPHYSSGVYNKAYCLLSKTPGWDQRKAFQVFALANYIFWSETEDFDSAACGAMEAARALHYPVADLQAALQAVGVQCVPRGQGS